MPWGALAPYIHSLESCTLVQQPEGLCSQLSTGPDCKTVQLCAEWQEMKLACPQQASPG